MITPTATEITKSGSDDSGERRSGSSSPQVGVDQAEEPRLPPPVVLQRQPSEVSAWVSEVDSHYHSDIEDDDESTLQEEAHDGSIPRAISQVVQNDDDDEADDELTFASRRSWALSEVDPQAMTSMDPSTKTNKTRGDYNSPLPPC